MKRRNAESGKMRRPLKRTKIPEGMYGNSLLYLKLAMVWAIVVMTDYMLEFRVEFVWPFCMMLKTVYDSFKYQGVVMSVCFIFIALTSDLICFLFIPMQWIFFAASTYVWVHYVLYMVADKGICLPTMALCCAVVYVEGVLRTSERGNLDLCRPFAAHCVGYPVVMLGFGVKSYMGERLRVRRRSQDRLDSQFYFHLVKDPVSDGGAEQNSSNTRDGEKASGGPGDEHRHMNGAVHRSRNRSKVDANGVCHDTSIHINSKVHLLNGSISKDKLSHSTSNGSAVTADLDDDRRDTSRGSAKSSKCERKEKDANILKEEKRRNKNKEKDKDKDSCDSHKSTEQSKENILKEKDIENIKVNKENNSAKDRERDRERERELREARECAEELKRVKAELLSARTSEEEARRTLAAAADTERQRRADYQQLRQQHTTLQHKVQTWRSLERRLGEERRARTTAEQQLLRAQQQASQRKSGECESESCRARRSATDTEAVCMRRDLQRARERVAQLQRDLATATDQVRSLESRCTEQGTGGRLAGAWASLQERAAHLERSLSSETRVKLDLLSALGEAKRQLNISESTIVEQEKEIAELKAQMLAVIPQADTYNRISKLRMSEGSPLDPNASVYTPKQLCSDA